LLSKYILQFLVIYLHDLLTSDMLRTIFFLLISTAIWAQDDHYTAEYRQDYGLIIAHNISAGQTIYGLTRHFGGEIGHTIALNDALDFTEVNIGDQLHFTLVSERIKSHKPNQNYVPLRFTVSKGETLYSIAKKYTNREVQDIMLLNHMSDPKLDLNQSLLIGYIELPYSMASDPIASTKIDLALAVEPTKVTTRKRQLLNVLAQTKPIKPFVIDTWYPNKAALTIERKLEELTIDSTKLASDESHQFTREKGLAYWQTINSNSKDLIVLHKNARINESITLFNPMMGREVKATVVAPIPEKSYPDNISVVISPAVAEALGALDKRFIVEMTY